MQMTWQPYTEGILELLPEICRSDRHVWRTSAPLICFDIVESHHPDRVLRQFGLEQSVPAACDTSEALHRVDRRAKNKNFQLLHRTYVEEWRHRERRVVQGTPFSGRSLAEYMSWYRRITRVLITPPTHPRPSTHYQPASNDIVLVVI